MTRFVAYYRVSTDRQGRSGLGLDAQAAAIAKFLRPGEDELIAPPFVEVESGKRNDRPELAKALSRCRAMEATLIVAKVDRLTRSASFLETLLESVVPVAFCDLPEIRGAVGRFLLQQMASVAQLEAGLISERTKAALRAKVERDGQWDRKAKHHLIPGAGQRAATQARQSSARARAKDLLPIIEDIRRDGTTSLGGIAAELNARGVSSARGGKWQAVQVRRVLDLVPGDESRATSKGD
ncbi:MAG: recombinase family protein [Pseudomonadota bacterium]